MAQAMPQLTALKTFHAVAKAGGVADAASRLNVTTGAVRHQIRLLEAELGELLLVRSKREFAMTPAGARLYETLSRAFEEIESACRIVSKPDLDGELRIACAPGLLAMRMMHIVEKFSQRFPLVTLRLFSIEQADESMDLIIAYGERPISGTRYAILKDERFFAVCSPELLYQNPVRSVEDLGAHVLLHSDGEQDWQRLLRALGKPRMQARQNIHFPNAYLSIQAAREDCGIAIGSSILCAEDLRRGTLVKVLDEEIPAPFPYFVIQPEDANRSFADVFAAMLVEYLERL